MKQLGLIPVLLITTTPILSVVSCNNQQVTYEVTQKEMEKAIALEGVKYIQNHFAMSIYGGVETTIYQDTEFSPTIYHSTKTWKNKDNYEEECVVKNNDMYWTYSRTSKTQEIWDSNETYETKFQSVEKLGRNLKQMYQQPLSAEKTYSFDNEKKCYTAIYDSGDKTLILSFYFVNKKLVKYDQSSTSELTGDAYEVAELTYNNTTPQLPIPEYDQEVRLTYTPATDLDWECLLGPVGPIPALTYKVVADFSQWQGEKEDIFIFYITQNAGWLPYTPTTITVKSIMDGNGVGFSVVNSYEEMANKPRSYVPGNYTDCFINYDIAQSPIVNFYVKVNAPIDEPYRFTVYDEDYRPD